MGRKFKKTALFIILLILLAFTPGFINSSIFAPYREEIIDWMRDLPLFNAGRYKSFRNEVLPEIVIITLKNGGKITGVIQEEKPGGIMVDAGFGTVTITRSEIERIDEPAPGDKEKISEEWQEHAFQTTSITRSAARKDIEEYYKRVEENLKIKGEVTKRGIEVRYYGSEENRIIVEAVLNGRIKTLMIVDTGATSVCITPEIAKRLGGIPEDTSKRTKVKWVDGTVTEAIPAVLTSVKIGEAKAENVSALVSDMPPFFDPRVSGLLGMSFLNKFHVTIDPVGKNLILEEK